MKIKIRDFLICPSRFAALSYVFSPGKTKPGIVRTSLLQLIWSQVKNLSGPEVRKSGEKYFLIGFSVFLFPYP